MYVNRLYTALYRVALKVALAFAFVLLPSLFLRAQERTLRVYYPYDDATLMRNYMNNAEIFAQFEELLADGDVPSFEIVSYSSPEGDWNYNLRLSRRRAKSLKVYLERKYPQLIGHITINPNAESWEELHRLVSSDSRLSEIHRAEILQIVDSDKAPDVKERELKRMEGYRMFYKHFFRGLRYAQISVVDETTEPQKVADSGTDGVVSTDEIVVTDSTSVISAVSENVEDSVKNTETAEPASNNSSAVSGSAVTASVSTPSEVSENAGASAGDGTTVSVEGVPVVYFLYNEDFIRPDYKNNEANLQEIVRLIKAGEITDFTIAGFSSPEGSVKVNESLSYRRAMAFKNYIVNLLPELEGRINIVNGGENWSGLREQVENGTALTEGEKEEVLGIIDSNDDPQTKEIRLIRTNAYRKIGHSYFPNIRRASFVRNAGQPAGTTVQDTYGKKPVVYFMEDDSRVVPSYMGNDENIEEIRNILSDAGNIRSLRIEVNASPIGSENSDDELAQNRADSFIKLLLELRPDLEGKIEVVDGGANWDGLRKAVQDSRVLSDEQKSEVLAIIDDNDTPANKEARIKASSAWDIIRDNILPRLRFAGISNIEKESETEPAGTEPADTTAQDTYGKKPVVYFMEDDSRVVPSYMGNDENIEEIRNILSDAGNIRSLRIEVNASPIGSENSDDELAQNRADSFIKLLLELRPDLEGKIEVVDGGANWDGLRKAVQDSRVLSDEQKSEVLAIIDDNDTPANKEARIKASSAWDIIRDNILPRLRFAGISNIEKETETEPAGTEPQGDAPATTDKGEDGAFVYYMNNDDQIRPSYMDNDENIEEIRRILSNPDGVRRIVVVGTASPEGPEKYNEELAQRRAESFVKMLLDLCPELEGKIEIKNAGENWDGLRRAVLASRRLTQRQKDEVVRIIDSNDSPRRKEQRLMSTSAWRIIRDEILPKMRCAGISGIEFEPVDDSPAAPQDLQPVVDTLATQIDTTDIQIDTTFTQIDTTFTPIDTLERKPEVKPRYPVVAVSTNLALDAIVAPNFALEVPLNKKWSAYAEYTFPWWLSKNNDWCYEMLKWDFGMRYRISNDFDWDDPMDILKGHFVGVDLSAGYYDFEPRHNGYQGEFQMATLEYGYAWDLGNNWRLDAVIGAGWMGTHYRYYEADATDKHLIYQHSAKMNWFGPTKLGVSVKYIFTTSKERKR